MKLPTVFEIRFISLLLSFLLIGPQLALAQVRVEAGSSGNKVILSILNNNESVIEDVRVEVFKSYSVGGRLYDPQLIVICA